MARYDALVMLMSTTYVSDDNDVQQPVTTERKVYANQMSMGASAFYAAAQAGIHPSAVLQVRRCDYEGETTLVFDGTRLSVSRVAKTPDYVTLTCEEVTSDRG